MYSDKDDEINDQVEFNMENAKQRLEFLLLEYNKLNAKSALKLLILDDTVHHVTRMVRVLSQPSNHNIILLGEGKISKLLEETNCNVLFCSWEWQKVFGKIRSLRKWQYLYSTRRGKMFGARK